MVLAQQGAASVEAFVWAGVLIVATVIGGVIVMAFRRGMLAKVDDADPGTIMESLRAMRDRGDLSDEEFQAARRRLVDRVRAEPASGGDAADTSKTPDASVTSRAGAAGLRARPGFDLTGAPLPPSTDDPSTPNNREDPPPA